MLVYDTVPGVSSPAFSASRNCDPGIICQQDGKHRKPESADAFPPVPWFGVASITTSSVSDRTSGHQRTAHRGCSPPWLAPSMSTLRPDFAAMKRTAYTTYSVDTWLSSYASLGRST